MDSERIKILLEKYWDGLTSREEEAQIKEYFTQGTFDPELQREADLFLYYIAQSNIKSSAILKDIKKIKSAKGHKESSKVVRWVWNSLKIAAVLVVVVTASWIVRNEMKDSQEQLEPITDTFSDPNEAFEETKKALLLISKNLGKGRTEAAKLKGFSKAEEVVKSTVKKQNEEENI